MKKPKIDSRNLPKNKDPRVSNANKPESYNQKSPVWQFSLIDKDGPFGWQGLAGNRWWEKILPSLQSREQMTWQQILSESGGKSNGNGTNNHPITIENLSPGARKRLKDLGIKDVYELFSLRVTGKERIFGIRQDNVLKVLWYDDDHKVCPLNK